MKWRDGDRPPMESGMGSFVVNLNEKYDPDKDPEKPVVGALVDPKKPELGKIAKVVTLSEMKELQRLIFGPAFDKEGYDEIYFFEHPSRPFVKWLAWANLDKTVEPAPKAKKIRKGKTRK